MRILIKSLIILVFLQNAVNVASAKSGQELWKNVKKNWTKGTKTMMSKHVENFICCIFHFLRNQLTKYRTLEMTIFKFLKFHDNQTNPYSIHPSRTPSQCDRLDKFKPTKEKCTNPFSRLFQCLFIISFGCYALTTDANALKVGFHPTIIFADKLRCADLGDAVDEALERLAILGVEVTLEALLAELNLDDDISSSDIAHILLDRIADRDSDDSDTVFNRALAAGNAILKLIGTIDCVNQTEGQSVRIATDYISNHENKKKLQRLDVVVFTGIFTEQGRDTIIAELASVFPHSLVPESVLFDTVDSVLTSEPIGSGYLLLSKIPLEPILPHLNFPERQLLTGNYIEDPASRLKYKKTGNHFFGVYHRGAEDTEIGLLGVRVQYKGSPTYLFFSDLSTFSSKETQLANLEKAQVLLTSVNEWGQDSERVFLFVNTDIDGHQATLVRTTEGRYTLKDMPKSSTADQYVDVFGDGYFIHDIFDIWPAIAPIEDTGNTRDFVDEIGRFSMMFAEPSVEAGCVQHPKHHKMAESYDHLLTFDFTSHHEFCTPSDADVILSSDFSNPDVPRHEKSYHIESAGHAVWTLVETDNPETISVLSESSTPGHQSEIYSATNISEPLIPFSVHPDRGEKFSVPEKFYIKTFFNEENKTGEIRVIIQRHDCKSIVDSCLIMPNEEQISVKPIFPGTISDVVQRDLFYELKFTNSIQFGLEQTLEFRIEDVAEHFIEHKLLEVKDGADPAPVIGFSESPLQIGRDGDGIILLGYDKLGGDYYLQLTMNQEHSYEMVVKMYTDISILQGTAPISIEELDKAIDEFKNGKSRFALLCRDETDREWGQDEMSVHLKIDDRDSTRIFDRSYQCDNGGVSKSFWVKNAAYKKEAGLTIVEGDGGLPDDVQTEIIPKLGFNEHSVNYQIDYKEDDGHYVMEVNVRSRLDIDEKIAKLRRELEDKK